MKLVLTAFLFFLLPFSGVFAESDIRMKGLENRINHLENNTPSQTIHPITPCAGPKVREGKDINLSLAFLFWTARLDGLTYAKTGFGDPNQFSTFDKGDIYNVKWSWDPGFKAGIGWNFCHGCWDMSLQYTWFYTNVDDSKATQHYIVPGVKVYDPTALIGPTQFQKASAHYDLHYQVGDLELGRNFYVSKTLKLRPFFGFKGTWQKQDYNVFYETVPFIVALSPVAYSARFDHALWGIGGRGGCNSSWQFSKAFSFYGNLALSAMWLHYNIERKDLFSITSKAENVVDQKVVDTEGSLSVIKPVLELGVGLRAETYFGCGRYHILLEAGWESQVWANQTLLITVEENYDKQDLSLQGLTAKIRLDF